MYFFLLLSCSMEKPVEVFSKGIREEWGQTGVLRSGTASSVFTEGSLVYSAQKGADGNHKSSWCAQKGDARAWLHVESPCHGNLLGVMVRNGFAESRISFSQRDRVHKADLVLFVDGVEHWSKFIMLHDTIQPQYLDIADVKCTQSYSLKLIVRERFDDVGSICVSELQAMVAAEEELEIVMGETHDAVEVPARVSLEVFAGPSQEHTLLGHAPILLTQYGAPYVRVVEERGEFVRFDRLRRRFAPEESVPFLDDPSSGGWVHRSQLDWDVSFP